MKINAEIGFFKMVFLVSLLGIIQGASLVGGFKLWDLAWSLFIGH